MKKLPKREKIAVIAILICVATLICFGCDSKKDSFEDYLEWCEQETDEVEFRFVKKSYSGYTFPAPGGSGGGYGSGVHSHSDWISECSAIIFDFSLKSDTVRLKHDGKTYIWITRYSINVEQRNKINEHSPTIEWYNQWKKTR